MTTTAVARATDPETSHAAAASVNGITARQHAVLSVLKTEGPMTDADLVARYPEWFRVWNMPKQSESGIRTRRSELRDIGFVVDSGERRTLASGRYAIVWQAV